MTKDNHATNIIKDKLDVSHEASDMWVSDDGTHAEHYPAQAVLLLTRCCKINHEHISLTHSEAEVLGLWLLAFAKGEYDE